MAIDKKRLFRGVLGGGVALAVLGGGAWWLLHRGQESTDDAQVDAEVVPVPARVGGVVTAVHFAENQLVTANFELATLDDSLASAKLAVAEADLASAKAAADGADADVTITSAGGSKEIAQAKSAVAAAESAKATSEAELARSKRLVAANAAPQDKLDSAQSGYDSALSNLEQARARLAAAVSGGSEQAGPKSGAVAAQNLQARARAATAHARVQASQAARELAALELSWTHVTAPRDGIASRKTIAAGQMVQPGQPVAMLVPTSGAWVTANFKETQLARMRPGQPATIRIDGYPGVEIEAEVQSFSGATGARFSLLPPDNATGNFTKVVQRVPVRLKLKNVPASVSLRAGMSAEATVDVAAVPRAADSGSSL